MRLITIENLCANCADLNEYRKLMEDTIDNMHETLMHDTLFVSQMSQPMNRRSDLYAEYKERLDMLIIQTIDPSLGERCMLIYNLLRDDYIFFDKWRNEMFEFILKETHRNG